MAFCKDALDQSRPIILASINYRLGALGFLHCPEAAEYLPSNNGYVNAKPIQAPINRRVSTNQYSPSSVGGAARSRSFIELISQNRLYDQILAFEWIRAYVAGFGGDPNNVTAIGQSAGAASLSLHNARSRSTPLYQKAINLSGSTTVLVTMTPEEHQHEFLYQAEKLGIDIPGRSIADVAKDVMNAPIDAIRGLDYSGAPCSSSELIPETDWATMRRSRHTRPNTWLESQIFCSSTYDGSLSHLVSKGQERTQLARIFTAICRARLKNSQYLLDLYQISEHDDDDAAIEKICHVVTDLGFYGAVISGLLGAAESLQTKSYLLQFDIGNPFTELLEKGRFATHTWDIVSLLGAYDAKLPVDCRQGISEWRQLALDYCYTGNIRCEDWRPGLQSALLVQKDGIECLDHSMLVRSRAQKLLDFAELEGGESGYDLLWENIVRFFLKTGNPRYSHEATDIIERYG